jgi:hypothetical protein
MITTTGLIYTRQVNKSKRSPSRKFHKKEVIKCFIGTGSEWRKEAAA